MSFLALKTALIENDIASLALIPKSDLHNHSMLGSRFESLESYVGKDINRPPQRMNAFHIFEDYLNQTFKDFIAKEGFFRYMLQAAFHQANEDGIEVLQMSIDSRFLNYFPRKEKDMVEIVEAARKEIAPQIRFIPQLGMDRTHNINKLNREAFALMETGYFTSIDLYGDELFGDIKWFIPIYKEAKRHKMKLCAHAGEYGSAVSVRDAIEILELQEVQHGLGVATSQEIMKWIAENKIMLNVCPTSNVVLCRAESIKKHPIRKLFDHGIQVTINTDDLLVFGQSVSDEYMNLYREGVFSAEELEMIRLNGLNVE
ncbi:MAG: adenosine deaminase [Bacteroidota bacterium]